MRPREVMGIDIRTWQLGIMELAREQVLQT